MAGSDSDAQAKTEVDACATSPGLVYPCRFRTLVGQALRRVHGR